MTKLSDLHKEWMKDPEYRAEYEASQPAFDLMKALIRARSEAGLAQQEVAERMGTTQSAIARLEGWTANPSVNTLRRYAEATGTRLRIWFEPIEDEASIDDESETPQEAVAETTNFEVDVAEVVPVST